MENKSDGLDETTINVAQQIRILRERRNLTQRSLAEASDLSRNTLSLLERGQTSPTVSTLKRLATALGVDINAFFNPIDEERVVHTKSQKRPNLELAQGVMSDLGVGMHDQLVTPLILQLDPGARSGPPLSHDGQDFVYCLRGEVLYNVNGKAYILESGDSLFFDGHLLHRFQTTAAEKSEVLIILSTPHESIQYISEHFPDEQDPNN
jgi:transcriptional regulator with XRE-family HTH domain